jgi:glyoxylase-like metal-dependent hydrolase (beta-lactamase superfamily II)
MSPRADIHACTSDAQGLIVNAWLVEGPEAAVLVDGAISRGAAAATRARALATGKPLAGALLTHGHPDHWIGLAEILADRALPIHATAGATAQARDRLAEEVPAMRAAFGADFPAELRLPDHVEQDGDRVVLGGLTFRLSEYGAAESDACATWELAGADPARVFCGDLIYNHMHLFMLDGHAEDWLAALDRLARAHPPGTVFHPGHGAPCGHEMIHWTRAYLETWLETVGHLIGPDGRLPDGGEAKLLATLRSFLPSDALIDLAQFRLDRTIRNQAGAARRAVETAA